MSPLLSTPDLVWRTTDDVDAVHALHLASLSTEPPLKVRSDKRAHFEAHQGEGGWTIACFVGTGRMVAYGLLALQLPSVPMMAAILGIDPARLCSIDGMGVHPGWRGRRLHQSAIELRLEHGASLGLTEVAATVAPQNVHSLRGMLQVGFEARRLAYLYGGQARFLVHRLTAPACSTLHPTPRNIELSVAVTDVAGHEAALATGLVGHDCRQTSQGVWLVDYSGPRAAS